MILGIAIAGFAQSYFLAGMSSRSCRSRRGIRGSTGIATEAIALQALTLIPLAQLPFRHRCVAWIANG